MVNRQSHNVISSLKCKNYLTEIIHIFKTKNKYSRMDIRNGVQAADLNLNFRISLSFPCNILSQG